MKLVQRRGGSRIRTRKQSILGKFRGFEVEGRKQEEKASPLVLILKTRVLKGRTGSCPKASCWEGGQGVEVMTFTHTGEVGVIRIQAPQEEDLAWKPLTYFSRER